MNAAGRILLALVVVAAALAPGTSGSQNQGPYDTVTLHAQQPTAPAVDAPPAAGGEWNFGEEEEEAAPTWADDVRAQAVDLAVLAAFLVFAFVSFFRKSNPLKYAT